MATGTTATSERGAPQTGKALFRWARDQDEDIFHALTAYGQAHGFKARIVDWDAAQVAQAFDAVQQREEG